MAKKFEYKTFTMFGDKKPSDLTRMGQQGWELVNVIPMGIYVSEPGGQGLRTPDILWIFKRELD